MERDPKNRDAAGKKPGGRALKRLQQFEESRGLPASQKRAGKDSAPRRGPGGGKPKG